MNFLQVVAQNQKLAKEYKANYVKLDKKTFNKLTLDKSKINENIEIHFARSFDASNDDISKEYECVFYHKDGDLIYQIIVPYSIEWDEYFQDDSHISVTDTNGNNYSKDDFNLKITHTNINPLKSSTKQNIEEFILSETNDYKDELC